MKRIFTLIATLFVAVAVNAQTTTPVTIINQSPNAKTAVPEDLLMMKEIEFDFGKIPQGKPVTHIFAVSNKSKDTLKISNVAASCGCTTPEWDKDKAVPPGTDTRITVGYNAAAEGAFTKQITITYNEAQVKIITIKGEVWKTPVSSAPENKNINDLKN